MLRNKKKIVALTIALVLGLSALCAVGIPALAYGDSGTNLVTLFNETNTYNCTSVQTKN